ncbi:hypothetical protein [Halogeometricum limi]|uniref:Uncharacterized protein n=1 Tax=Halogeometricum limi TaxID=555875 RepID=A0A1I6HG96_9EURY|nr:hypothetical protein [Halogeometricum limi]SFR53535.1 hypothetical protein SAMN04488124_2214 [Halogeometricum limi]
MQKSTKRKIRRFLLRVIPIGIVIAIALVAGARYGINLGTLLTVIPASALLVALWSLASGRSPRKDEILETVYSSSPDEWEYKDSEGIYTYKKNTDVRLEDEDYQSRMDFDEPWVHNYSNSTAYRRSLYIYHRSSLIDKKTIIQADETRVFIPLPTVSDLTITQDENKLGQIVNYNKRIDGPRGNHIQRYERYLDEGGITVQPQTRENRNILNRVVSGVKSVISV